MSCLRTFRAILAALAWGLTPSAFGAGPSSEQVVVAGVPMAALTLTADDLKAFAPAQIATAADGYRVVFSWPELFDTEVGAGTLLVFERDGQPLAEREGRIALVSASDQRSARGPLRLDVRVAKE